MLTPDLKDRSSTPLYQQLYTYIRAEIEGGRLSAGERLPSKRALAAHLKISVVTVESAYGQLLAEGYVAAEPKRGFFVQAIRRYPAAKKESRSSSPPSSTDIAENHFTHDFATNAVDTDLFPFSTWAKLTREVLSAQDKALLSATHPQGAPELRQAVVNHLYRFRGISVSPEQIVIGAGSEYLTSLLVQLLGPQGGYGVENPGYRKIDQILTCNGASVVHIPLDGQGLQVSLLESAPVRVAHVTPSHHFPLGTVMPVTRRTALLEWADREPDRYIIEDDYDSEFPFDHRPIPALQSLDREERVIYLNTFAKSLAPSLRIGYMVLPPHLAERYRQKLRFYSSTVPSFEQYTLARFMEQGYFERHISRTRSRCKLRKEALLAAAESQGLLEFSRFLNVNAGLHLLLQVENGLSEQELTARAAERGVRVHPLSDYYAGPLPQGHIPTLVMGYAQIPPEDMESACRALRQAWRTQTATGGF